jgi:hypothetical protein
LRCRRPQQRYRRSAQAAQLIKDRQRLVRGTSDAVRADFQRAMAGASKQTVRQSAEHKVFGSRYALTRGVRRQRLTQGLGPAQRRVNSQQARAGLDGLNQRCPSRRIRRQHTRPPNPRAAVKTTGDGVAALFSIRRGIKTDQGLHGWFGCDCRVQFRADPRVKTAASRAASIRPANSLNKPRKLVAADSARCSRVLRGLSSNAAAAQSWRSARRSQRIW